MYKERFSDRHNSISAQEEKEMLQMLGYNEIEQLISQTIPDEIRLKKELEVELLEK
jgi:glycine dehydrogenase